MARFRKPARRWLLVWLLLCAGAVAASLAVIAEVNRRTPFWDKYQKVRLGMTEAEVKNILGPPAAEEYPGGGLGPMVLTWVEGEQQIVVFIYPEFRGELALKKGFLPKSLWEQLRDPSHRSVITYP
jgi:hypothetical protein